MEDNQVLKHIEQLVADEERLYAQGHLSDAEVQQLHSIKIRLDQYWDFLRQRRSLRNAGENPADAKLRSPNTVENYKQ